MGQKILFIINPNSGPSSKPFDKKLIEKYLPNNFNGEVKILTTEKAGHARELTEANKSDYDKIAAVGGDGTINEVASGLVGSDTRLGIIPRGSGNGLAFYLGIPKNLKKCLSVILDDNFRSIDTAKINNHFFINMAGIGFDAHVAHLFANFGSRGLLSYSRLVLREYSGYPGIQVITSANGQRQDNHAFLMSFANSSQYGNNAHIAPQAAIDDGLIDVCFIKKPTLLSSPVLVNRLFNKSINKSRLYNTIQTDRIEIESEIDMKAHVDGEPIMIGKKAAISVNKQSINVLVPTS